MSGVSRKGGFLFFTRFLANPGMVGSIIPSSSFLANKMVKLSDLSRCKNIIEIGAGTGVFTQNILANKADNCNLYVFEKDPFLRERLRDTYPNLKLFSEAACLEELLQNRIINKPQMVISGLPFAVMGRTLSEKILTGIYNVLPKGGKFVTFQYSLNLYRTLKRMYGSIELEFEPLNIPPAIIYRCIKK